jgi:uncharacterized tellurite resistance protein B-like protein
LGQNWAALERLMHGINRTGCHRGPRAIGIAVWLVRRHKRTRAAELRAQISQELEAYPAMEAQALVDPAVAAVVALLLETHTDERDLSPEEFDALTAHFRDRWHLAQAGASLTPEAAREIVRSLAPTERIGVMQRVRRVMFGDGDLARREARVMSRVAQVLGIE